MIFNNKSDIKRDYERNVNLDDVYIPDNYEEVKDFTVKMNEKYYYYKYVSQYEMINELIGSYLSKVLDLRAVDYEIGNIDGDLVALSELFFKRGYSYTNSLDYFFRRDRIIDDGNAFSYLFRFFYFVETKFFSSIPENMKDDILKLTAIDLKMGQFDRHNQNITLQVSKDDVSLAEVYDFGGSYQYDGYFRGLLYYDNPFILVRKNGISLSSLCRRFPMLYEYIDILKNTSIIDILCEIEQDKNIKFTETEYGYYYQKDCSYNKLLRKVK